ncbi:CGCGG family putative rSAM-modified RiPP protein [Neobacillus jeddahensis]|uniref:CGCGG family putative rSAM-modified RiPP protein n=1 Tax=Neobacillus jeddahensis TaxID=1461580 RepID=UPI00058E4AC5|nr:CGCGG family rSAM-modified RiPP protein [Neobacillus jeddahensis]
MMKTKNWSIALEHGEYEENKELVIQEAISAIHDTGIGLYVNVVTPSTFGNPENYLQPVIEDTFGDHVTMKFIDQCGCGGYVLRVWKNK